MIEWGLLSDAPRPIGLAAARVLHTKRKFVCTCVCKKTDAHACLHNGDSHRNFAIASSYGI